MTGKFAPSSLEQTSPLTFRGPGGGAGLNPASHTARPLLPRPHRAPRPPTLFRASWGPAGARVPESSPGAPLTCRRPLAAPAPASSSRCRRPARGPARAGVTRRVLPPAWAVPPAAPQGTAAAGSQPAQPCALGPCGRGRRRCAGPAPLPDPLPGAVPWSAGSDAGCGTPAARITSLLPSLR